MSAFDRAIACGPYGAPITTVVEHVTEYELSLLHETHPDHDVFSVQVAYRGGGLWAVLWLSRSLDENGNWDYEPPPSSRTNAWLAEHRWPLDEALGRARAALPRLHVNGRTVDPATGRLQR